MKKIIYVQVFLCFSIFLKSYSQPFADIASFNYQTFNATHDQSSHWKNKTDDYFLNLFIPKVYANGNTLLIRLNTEKMNSVFYPDSAYSSNISAISIPLGMKLVSTSKKWETVLLAIPKLASDFKDKISHYDFQFGGVFLEQYNVKDNLKIKAGLYYNREAFGNFFVPLVGVDWKASRRVNFYGILPTNYRMEVNILKDKLYAGLNLKYFTRSFRLSQEMGRDYVRYNEGQIKLFLDYFVYKRILIFGEIGYSIAENPIQYQFKTKDENYFKNEVYSPAGKYPIFNVGVAYRVRLDLKGDDEKQAEF